MADPRAIAEAATTGPWVITDDCIVAGTPDRHGERTTLVYLIELARPTADAAHIAAWSPDRALAALDVIGAAQKFSRCEMCSLATGTLCASHRPDVASALARWEAL